jgi:hypothetical protein
MESWLKGLTKEEKDKIRNKKEEQREKLKQND